MSQVNGLSELRKRIDRLESDLEWLRRRAARDASNDNRPETLLARAMTFRPRTTTSEKTLWGTSKRTLRDEWGCLYKAFVNWAAGVDERYRRRRIWPR